MLIHSSYQVPLKARSMVVDMLVVDEAARVVKGSSVDVDEGEAAPQMLLNLIPKRIVPNLGLQVLCWMKILS